MNIVTYVMQLMAGDAVPRGDEPPAFAPGTVYEVSNAVYLEYLDMLPPRFMGRNFFCFGEGAGTLRLFWTNDGQHYARELTEEQTDAFCRVAGIARST